MKSTTEETYMDDEWHVHFQEPQLTDIARTILEKRYLVKNMDGEVIETPQEMFWRVAQHVASAEENYPGSPYYDAPMELALKFYDMMSQGYWLPNSPTLANAGRDGGLGQLSACFVLPVDDCMSNGQSGIYDTLTNMALIHQSGGGTGFSFSRLRPSGAMVKSTTGVASGPVSFMTLYDASTNVVKQGGMRRGANMGILRVNHPDILEFIDCKKDTSKVTNFNISVAVTDDFMQCVENDWKYPLMFNGESYGELRARDVWNKIVENAHATGEPGLFFIDEANRHNPVPHLGDYEATNPCGEQCLLPYDVCNLGSLNLGKFVDEDGEIDHDKMRKYIDLSVRFLDNVIDMNNYPLPEIKERAQQIRRIGNGVMGFADMLIKMGIPYGSNQSLQVADSIAEFFVEECKLASRTLGYERGVYPEALEGEEQRNCNVTTVAPTGTISMIAGCSGGIEPLYAVVMKRNQAGEEMMDVNPMFYGSVLDVAKHQPEPGEYTDKIIEDVYNGVMEPSEVDNVFQTSASVTPEQHIRMQAAWQNHICNAISKTINLPHEATVEDVEDAYKLAHTLKCKGVTVYRDGSRPGQVLSTGKTDKKEQDDGEREEGLPDTTGQDRRSFERPGVLYGETRKVDSPIGSVYVTLNSDDGGRPIEVLVSFGKAGSTTHSFGEAIGRLISIGLQEGVDIANIYSQLRGISSERAVGIGPNKVLSGPDAIALALGKAMEYENGDVKVASKAEDFAACPDCNSELYFSEGCYNCQQCGYSGCS